jgi:mannose-1-phosphate guanylyltransferase
MHEKIEKPPGKTANAAIYILDSKGLDQIEEMKHDGIDLSTQIIPKFLGRIYGYQIANYHRDIGSPSSLSRAHQEMTHSQIISLTAPTK